MGWKGVIEEQAFSFSPLLSNYARRWSSGACAEYGSIFSTSPWPSPPRLWDAVMERGSDSLDVTAEETEKGEKGDKNNG